MKVLSMSAMPYPRSLFPTLLAQPPASDVITSCFSKLTTDSRISRRLASCSAHTETPVV